MRELLKSLQNFHHTLDSPGLVVRELAGAGVSGASCVSRCLSTDCLYCFSIVLRGKLFNPLQNFHHTFDSSGMVVWELAGAGASCVSRLLSTDCLSCCSIVLRGKLLNSALNSLHNFDRSLDKFLAWLSEAESSLECVEVEAERAGGRRDDAQSRHFSKQLKVSTVTPCIALTVIVIVLLSAKVKNCWIVSARKTFTIVIIKQ